MRSAIEVLIVEDNPADADLACEVLEGSDLHLTLAVATDGEQAVRQLKESETFPSLILLDLNLPRKSGHEVLAEIKEDVFLRQIPVVVLTSSSAEQDIIRSYDLGANCYLRKPMDLRGYRDIVHAVEDFWLNRVRLPNQIAKQSDH